MGECLSEIVGVLGFVLAVISLLWQVSVHRQSHKERVTAELSLDTSIEFPAGALLVDVVNVGRVPVYLEAVTLAWGREGDTVAGTPFMPYRRSDGPLQVGQSRRFVLLWSETGPVRMAAEQPEETLWVGVRSARGEVLRLKGRQVSWALAALTGRSGKPPATRAAAAPPLEAAASRPEDPPRADGPSAGNSNDRPAD